MADRTATTPTEDLYLRAAMDGVDGWRRAAPGAYVSDGAPGRGWAIVVRRTDPAVLRELIGGGRSLHYVLDDDVAAGWRDPSLPLAYRWRLLRLWRGTVRPLLRAGATLHVPSHALRLRMTPLARQVRRIAPCHPVPPRDAPTAGGPIRVAYLGTRSHRADIRDAAPELALWLRRHPDRRLVTFAGEHVPAALRACPNAEHRAPLEWSAFRTMLRVERFHAVIAPALPTRFNAARSHSRLLECAALGAVPVVSSHLEASRTVASEGLGLVALQNRGWEALLDRAVSDPGPAGRLIAHAREQGAPERLRRYWDAAL